MSGIPENEQKTTFDPVNIPIDCEWILEREFVKTLEDGNYNNSKDFNIPGFCGLYYYVDFVVETYNVCSHLKLCAEKTANKFYANLKFSFSCNEFNGLKKEFIGACDNFDTNYEFTNIELFTMTYEDWIHPNNPIFADNQFVIRVEGYITVEEMNVYCFQRPEQSLYKWIGRSSSTEMFIIVAEDKEIKVAKKILQERSKVFARMFESSWKETLENRIEIPEFPFKIVQIAIEALNQDMFTVDSLNKTEFLQIYQFADKYDIDILKETLKNSIDFLPYTIVEYANLAVEYGFEEFEDWCIDYLILCAKHGYSVADIDKLNEKVKNAFVQKLFINAKTTTEPNIWKHKCINDNETH